MDSEDQIIRRVIPLNQWTAFVPKAASNLFGGVVEGDVDVDAMDDMNQKIIDNINGSVNATNANTYTNTITNTKTDNNNTRNNTARKRHDLDAMLFDAVPFNGDTDRDTNSYTSALPNFTDMNINIPLKHSGSNISNISPMGNVSSRVPFDDDDSDDDLDRILGSMKARLRKEQQKELNRTLPTLLSASNSLESEREREREEDVAALGECVFHKSNGYPLALGHDYHDSEQQPDENENENENYDSRYYRESRNLSWTATEQQLRNQSQRRYSTNSTISKTYNYDQKDTLWKRFRSLSRRFWLISVCILLVLTLSVMIGVLLPSMLADRNQNLATASELSSVTHSNATYVNDNSANAPTKSPTTMVSLTSPPAMLRPTMGGQEASSHRESPPPTEQPVFLWSSSETYEESYNSQGSSSQENGARGRLPQIRLEMGPMVGHTTHDTVTLWAYYLKPAIYLFEENYSLKVLLYDSDGWLRTIDETEPDRDKNNAVFVTVTNLEPLREYRYEMTVMDQVVGSGSFRTAPPPISTSTSTSTSGVAFEYLLASCMDRTEYPVQKAWQAIPTIHADGSKEYPDFAILAGDTIYLQEGIDVDDVWGVDFERYWHRSYEQRTEPHFADFVSNTPIYSTWNNHDYGSPDATGNQIGKEESLRAWNSLWPNPATPETNSWNANGIYYSFHFGDVHYIVTDDHWNRNSFAENRLGAEQTEWIRSELISSKGTFKIIVLGSDISERGWRTDLENIGAIVTEHSINGVLFHAGDIHRNEYKRLDEIGFPYPVTQITSSGIGKVWRKPFAKIAVDTTVEDPFIRVRFFAATTMEDDATWFNNPNLVCTTIVDGDRDSEHSCSETIRLSDLSFV